jgi:hypothetical protein
MQHNLTLKNKTIKGPKLPYMSLAMSLGGNFLKIYLYVSVKIPRGRKNLVQIFFKMPF